MCTWVSTRPGSSTVHPEVDDAGTGRHGRVVGLDGDDPQLVHHDQARPVRWRFHQSVGHARLVSKGSPRCAYLHLDGDAETVISGLQNLTVLKTTGSEFWGFPGVEYTSLVETTDRIMATVVTSRWRYVGTDVDWDKAYASVRSIMLDKFAAVHSLSLQQTLYAMGEAVLPDQRVRAERRHGRAHRDQSRFVVAAGGAILVILGLLPVLGRIMNAIPQPVLGGAGIVLFGSVAAAGIRTLSRVNFTNSNVLIVAVSIGVGIIPITVPEVYNHIPEWLATIFESGISATAIFAVVLNLAFNHFSKTDEPAAAEH